MNIFTYYKGCTYQECFKYVVYLPIKRFIYRQIYKFWLPNIITIKTPYSYLFKIIDNDGTDLTQQFPTIIKYNRKSKKATIRKIESYKPFILAKNKYGEDIYEIIEFPNSHVIFVK